MPLDPKVERVAEVLFEAVTKHGESQGRKGGPVSLRGNWLPPGVLWSALPISEQWAYRHVASDVIKELER